MVLSTTEERLELYDELIKEYPRSHVIKRLPFLISSGKSEFHLYMYVHATIFGTFNMQVMFFEIC